ncbi:MAG: hypothetical protein GW798_10175 [Roseovarius sp.]|nr:hypothetical protein [Roseovarius sp.]
MDMSLAGLLAVRGFDFDEIVQILLEHFQHGVAERDGWNTRSERAVRRCAARAIQHLASIESSRMNYLRETLNRYGQRQGMLGRTSNE